MILAGLAFVVAGFIQLKLQSVQQTLKSGESKVMIYNSAPFPLHFYLNGSQGFSTNHTLNNSEVSNY